MKSCDHFLNLAQNIDRVYTLEPTIYVLEQKLENNVYPCKPQFHYTKVGCKGVFITRTCKHGWYSLCPMSALKTRHSLQPRHSMSLSAVFPGKLSWDLYLKSRPKDWRSPGSNPRPLVYKASGFTTYYTTVTSSWHAVIGVDMKN